MTKSPLALMAVLLASAFTASAEPAGRTTPNIIPVFIDDMGWADFSCFGNKDAVTPTVDRMAAEGIAFESFYVNSPLCSPSRVAISTGTYPQRWRVTSYLAHSDSNNKRGIAWSDNLTTWDWPGRGTAQQ